MYNHNNNNNRLSSKQMIWQLLLVLIIAPRAPQIRANETPRGVLEAAHKLGGGKARPAMELIGYDRKVDAAMKYVFGNNFVCEEAGTAKKLAFSREVNTRCITLEGDDFNPGGARGPQ